MSASLKKGLRWAALGTAVAVSLSLAACTASTSKTPTSGATSGASGGGGRTYAIVDAATAGDTFWDVVKTGAEKAASIYGDKVTYQSDPDVQKQSQFIESAIAQKVDGLIVALNNAGGLRSALKDATAAGIPIVTINSGAQDSASVGAIAHVGQTEYIAGQAAGKQFAEAGAKYAICVIHEVGNIGLEDRCNGFTNTFGGKVDRIQVDISNIADAGNTIKSALISNPSIDAVLTLNANLGVTATQAVADAGSKAKVATFDLATDAIKAVQSGKLLFAIDQQQYEQGYLPVVLLELYITNGNTLGGGSPVLTGPGFVTKDNAASVLKFAENGTR